MGGIDVNGELVRTGMAWVYRQYLKDRSLLRIEEQARAAHVGLWAGPSPQAPWEYRRAKQGGGGRAAKAAAPSPQSNGAVQCGTKRYCREMTSCAEARAYLLQCGVRSLDGDGDGVPCETLCRR